MYRNCSTIDDGSTQEILEEKADIPLHCKSVVHKPHPGRFFTDSPDKYQVKPKCLIRCGASSVKGEQVF